MPIDTCDKKNIEALLKKIQNGTITVNEKKELKQFALSFKNEGQALDEHEHNYKKYKKNVHPIVLKTIQKV